MAKIHLRLKSDKTSQQLSRATFDLFNETTGQKDRTMVSIYGCYPPSSPKMVWHAGDCGCPINQGDQCVIKVSRTQDTVWIGVFQGFNEQGLANWQTLYLDPRFEYVIMNPEHVNHLVDENGTEA